MPTADGDRTTTQKHSQSTLGCTGPRFAERLQSVTPEDFALWLNSLKVCVCSAILPRLAPQGRATLTAPSKVHNEERFLFLTLKTWWIFVALLCPKMH